MVQSVNTGTIVRSLQDTRTRYLVAGGVNTVFGYGVGVIAYRLFESVLPVFFIGIAASVIAITFSFFTYRIFVFRSHGNMLHEYLRCYIVYGGSTILGAGLLWLFMCRFRMSIYIAQGIILIIGIVFSYVGHKHYTFSKKAVN